MLTHAIKRAFDRAVEKKWDKIYVGVDLHGVVIKPDYTDEEKTSLDYYPLAKSCLQKLSQRDDVCLIMYTCSHPRELEAYQRLFDADGIHFDHINKNPEVHNTRYGNYTDKPYFDILLEDKAGFYPETDWITLINQIIQVYPKNYLINKLQNTKV